MRITRRFCVSLLALLTACEGNDVRSTLGLNQRAPDEFVVYARPPLSVPPEFDLQPPQPGAQGPNAINPENEARKTLLGSGKKPATLEEASLGAPSNVETAVDPVLSADAPSGAQNSFLSKLGVDAADPEIRQKLQQEQLIPQKGKKPRKKKSQSLLESITGDASDEPVVDAKKEAERIRTNRDAGKPVTEGETPVEKNKSKSVLDQLF